MKILSVAQIREADKYTIENGGISSIDLMENAAAQCFDWLIQKFPDQKRFHVFCGKGNNGGDGLALSRMLHEAGKHVTVQILEHTDNSSPDFKTNLQRLEERDVKIQHTILTDAFEGVDPSAILVDAVLGSGLKKMLKNFLADFTKFYNQLENTKIAIDIPTGLFGDNNEENNLTLVAKADYTLTFQLPKLSFMMPETGPLCGEVEVLDIGLDKDFIKGLEANIFFTSAKDLIPHIQHRTKYSYKNQLGHGLLVVGSYGKFGAGLLASKAFMRSGAGLLTVQIPEKGVNPLQTYVPEAMVRPDRNEKMITELSETDCFSAVGIGPGIGTNYATRSALQGFFEHYQKPVVLDADALNLISEHRELLETLPHNSILTPHLGEFRNLINPEKKEFNTYKKLLALARKTHSIVVLKGPHTAIACPSGRLYFNSSGTPAMATAGAGDVLTGIITSLLARGYSPVIASRMGVYLHGKAGEYAQAAKGMESVIASDLIDFLPLAFQEVMETK